MLNAIFFYRVSRWCYLHHIPVIPRVIQFLIFICYNSKIAPSTKIGKNTYCICGGIGVLLHNNVEIGDNCQIGAHVCIIGKTPYKRVPVIGNNCFIGHNTVLCGPIIIGDGAIIANGAIVMKSVPENAIVAGIPAKIVGYRNELNYNFMGTNELKDDIMPFMT